jgi:hypothetical protein
LHERTEGQWVCRKSRSNRGCNGVRGSPQRRDECEHYGGAGGPIWVSTFGCMAQLPRREMDPGQRCVLDETCRHLKMNDTLCCCTDRKNLERVDFQKR